MKRSSIFLCISLLFIYSQGFGSDKKADKTKNILEVSGYIYTQFSQQLDGKTRKEYGFQVPRMYLHLKKRIDKIWRFQFTFDGGILSSSGDYTDSLGNTNAIETDSKRYEIFLKYGYAEATIINNEKISLKSKFGLIDTPIILYFNQISNYRWIDKNYIDNATKLLSGIQIDNSADVGGRLDLSIYKRTAFSYALVNGEGFKNVASETYRGKAHYFKVSISPFRKLYINGFARVEFYEPGKVNIFYGMGAAWKSYKVKTGINYITGTKEIDSKDEDKNIDYTLLEAWFNCNLKSALAIPILVYGQIGLGSYESKVPDVKSSSTETFRSAAGMGYKFNSKMKVGVYYTWFSYKDVVEGDQDSNDFYVKSEFRF